MVCTTLEICSMPSVSCRSISACCTAESAMRSISSVDCCAPATPVARLWVVSFERAVPCSTSFMEDSISLVISCAATELLLARLCTSSATTAKPFPAEPARAASTAAFKARILVWKEISSIILIIPLICREDVEISSMAWVKSFIFWLQVVSWAAASVEHFLAFPASSEVRLT